MPRANLIFALALVLFFAALHGSHEAADPLTATQQREWGNAGDSKGEWPVPPYSACDGALWGSAACSVCQTPPGLPPPIMPCFFALRAMRHKVSPTDLSRRCPPRVQTAPPSSVMEALRAPAGSACAARVRAINELEDRGETSKWRGGCTTAGASRPCCSWTRRFRLCTDCVGTLGREREKVQDRESPVWLARQALSGSGYRDSGLWVYGLCHQLISQKVLLKSLCRS